MNNPILYNKSNNPSHIKQTCKTKKNPALKTINPYKIHECTNNNDNPAKKKEKED